ncbi:probable RNA-binding protein EIF1AD isoform X2 [Leucoraja erinacea]|uniref:probable RNA-binding protein EIF1AD isoform X2 n=1 Tax=Leucoraja erinaceus TaxID=7782 RepID=UPI002457BCB4|nr:probable RNA-binding protein EIF1AD isoform X2 [Leucoraja erinacea]XP_055487779.1 probable RNA-binding protein EIF1AD isoform X2 [Leucoraja erinacea]
MSQATKRKHVVKEVLGDYSPPSEKQQIVRVVASPGNNLHEVETEEGGRFLASMPTKFRKNIWIKRGDFLIVDPIEEGEKVKGEIASILYKDHIKQLRKQGAWPAGFSEPGSLDSDAKKEARDQRSAQEREADGEGEDDSEDDGDLFVNTNRRNYEYCESEESEESEEGEGEGKGVREGETERG